MVFWASLSIKVRSAVVSIVNVYVPDTGPVITAQPALYEKLVPSLAEWIEYDVEPQTAEIPVSVST